ncbi:GNAT family N-acetyltransferase [Acetanaerobacterium elongatum]|uniref:Uncharacterized protein n=1 Tax=Acetanaerobacterium elongatum TaxID=258515 RepID=A0A1G9W9V8_9FIRM|nr:GNAT family N-acetyltransferase [Acetanaerobacterium elongatum]SDM81344.1 hypothetical protein SAMN05192585_10588 [Acetanaerobacterium elongatum]
MDFKYEEGRIYYTDDNGKLLAEVTYPAVSSKVAEINHTFVDDSLRGQGIAGQLLKACAEKLRSEGRRAIPSCSYAKGWFEKNKDYSDVNAENAERSK